MNNALKKFYYRFYTPLPMAESEQEIETCHQQLIERLEKPERKLVLRIMDASLSRKLKLATNNSLRDWKSQRESWCCGSWTHRTSLQRNALCTVSFADSNWHGNWHTS